MDLSRQAQAGSAGALNDLLSALQGPLYRYLLRRLRAAPDAGDLACDLCQDSLIRAAASIRGCTFSSDERLVAWVLTIARNVMLDHLRRAHRRAEVRAEQYWARVAAPGLLPGAEADPPRLLETFAAEVLADVNEVTAELLRLRLVGGRSWKQVADVLGITETAAKRRFQRAQATLRRQILARVDALPSDARRAALLSRLSGMASQPDGATFRSP